MSKKVRIVIQRTGWLLGAGFAALVLLMQVQASAHVESGAQWNWCSPHDATQSTSSSTFYNCERYGGTDKFYRTFHCKAGSGCANKDPVCNGQSVCGVSFSDGSTQHVWPGPRHPFNPSINITERSCGIGLAKCLQAYPDVGCCQQ